MFFRTHKTTENQTSARFSTNALSATFATMGMLKKYFFNSHPGHTLVRLLSLSVLTNSASAAQVDPKLHGTILRYPANTQHELLPSSSFSKPCFPQHQFFADYDVVSNVRDWRDVQLYVYTEHHATFSHHQKKIQYTKEIAHSGDVLIFEGLPQNVEMNCSDVCLQKDGVKLTTHPEECAYSFQLPNTLMCAGVEDPSFKNRIKQQENQCSGIKEELKLLGTKFKEYVSQTEIMTDKVNKGLYASEQVYNTDLVNMGKKTEQLIQLIEKFKTKYSIESKQSAYNVNAEILKNDIKNYFKKNMIEKQKIFGLVLKQAKYFDEIFSLLMKENSRCDKELDKLTVQDRNQVFEERIQFFKNKNPKKTLFFYVGLFHITPTETYTVGPKDPQYVMRKFLEGESHAVLIPKTRPGFSL